MHKTLEKTDYHFHPKDALVGVQFLFVAFGALVLVPILTGLNPNVALFTAGLGTLAFQIITRGLGGTVPPVFLASSFAFIAPISFGVKEWGIAQTMGGLIAAGAFYVVLSMFVRIFGKGFIHRLLPAVVVGPVIMSIGLVLSSVAVNMAIGKTGDGSFQLVPTNIAMVISFATLTVVLLASLLGRGFMQLIPILLGIVVGYAVAYSLNIIDFSSISQDSWFYYPEINALEYNMDFSKIASAEWFSMPKFTAPEFNIDAIIFILPIAIAPAVEHIGDMLAISNITNKDYLKKPGLENTLLGDGIATMVASGLGGPPNTTYSEVTGAVTITKAYNPAIMTWAALAAIVLAFVGKLGAILATIPTPVMGGIMLLLFGIITAVGIKTLATAKVNFDCPRNLGIIAIILVFAIGGMEFNFGGVAFSGIGLGAIVGIILNLILPEPRSDKND
ncbi:MAG: uracil-xanthine permease [Gammaproteobacteria bacterium]|nr:uracil-xanthine permease [Gammaproteobacteria bacterium]